MTIEGGFVEPLRVLSMNSENPSPEDPPMATERDYLSKSMEDRY